MIKLIKERTCSKQLNIFKRSLVDTVDKGTECPCKPKTGKT